MRKRRAGIRSSALLLACIMGMAQPAAVYAGAELEDITFPFVRNSGEKESVLTGNVKVELLSVAMPAGNFDFDIDTTAPFDVMSSGGGVVSQVTSPGIQVKNNSVVPVKLEITNVVQNGVVFDEPSFDGGTQSFRLVDRISEVGPPGTAILVLGVANQNYRDEQEFEHQALIPGKRSIFITNIGAETGTELSLYGKAAPDFYGAYRFTITPTLKISAVQAQPG